MSLTCLFAEKSTFHSTVFPIFTILIAPCCLQMECPFTADYCVSLKLVLFPPMACMMLQQRDPDAFRQRPVNCVNPSETMKRNSYVKAKNTLQWIHERHVNLC